MPEPTSTCSVSLSDSECTTTDESSNRVEDHLTGLCGLSGAFT